MRMITLLLTILLLGVGCNPQSQEIDKPVTNEPVQQEAVMKAEYIKITPEEAKERMAEEEVIVLDVRTQEEYDGGHIPGAVLLPVDQLEAQAPTVLPDLGAEILVYCRSGNRSRAASQTLIDMGYTKVLDFGGIIDWPYETVK